MNEKEKLILGGFLKPEEEREILKRVVEENGIEYILQAIRLSN